MMYQPQLSNHGLQTAPLQPRLERFARPVAVVTVLGVADADVAPLGVED